MSGKPRYSIFEVPQNFIGCTKEKPSNRANLQLARDYEKQHHRIEAVLEEYQKYTQIYVILLPEIYMTLT